MTRSAKGDSGCGESSDRETETGAGGETSTEDASGRVGKVLRAVDKGDCCGDSEGKSGGKGGMDGVSDSEVHDTEETGDTGSTGVWRYLSDGRGMSCMIFLGSGLGKTCAMSGYR